MFTFFKSSGVTQPFWGCVWIGLLGFGLTAFVGAVTWLTQFAGLAERILGVGVAFI
ncbi:hypothetical protein EMIT0194P_50344 [Pseudomonas serbica]